MWKVRGGSRRPRWLPPSTAPRPARSSPPAWLPAASTRDGLRAGLAFQIVDDVLDVTESSEQLGKTAGKDTAMVKATWPAIYGVEKSVRDARELIDSAFAELEGFGAAAAPLKMVARYLVDRKN